jgi:glutathione S-transferase
MSVTQSKTIARFLAKEYGIAGNTNLQQAKADMIVDCVTDIENARYKWVFVPDPVVQKTIKETFEKETLPKFLTQMLAIFQRSSGKFMVGDELTWADIAIAGFLDMYLPDAKVDGMEKFVLMTELMKRVFETPNIKKYVEKRPNAAELQKLQKFVSNLNN